MAYADVVQLDRYESWVEFHATFNSGATARWATGYVIDPFGRYEGIMRVDTINGGLPEARGAAPERVQASIEIDNSDGAISKYLIGTAGSDPSLEYSDDGVLNLQGSLWHGVKDPVTGDYYRSQISPTLYSVGDITYDGQKVTIPLASNDDLLIGSSWRPMSVRDLVKSTDSADTTVYWCQDNGATGTVANGWSSHVQFFSDNLDTRAPWVYGRNSIQLLPVTPKSQGTVYGDGRFRWIVGICDAGKEPYINSFANWECYHGNYANPFSRLPALPFSLYKAKRVVTVPLLTGGTTTTTVWVMWITTTQFREASQANASNVYLGSNAYAVPDHGNLGITTGNTPLAAGSGGPARIIEEIVKDHATGGGVDATSFTRTKKAIKSSSYGGVYLGDTPVSDLFAFIAGPAGIGLWIGKDDHLHAIPDNAWNTDEKGASDGGSLLHIRQSDIVGGWSEVIPRSPDARGAPATRVDLTWSDQQKELWSNSNSAFLLEHYSGSIKIPLSGIQVAEIDGSWVFPPQVSDALSGAGSKRNYAIRLIHATCRFWVGAQEHGTLFYLSHRLGLNAAGGGYNLRLVRLVRSTLHPMNDYAECVFEDMGQLQNVRPAKWDAYANWLYQAGAGNITLTAASDIVLASVPGTFTSAMVGRYLDTNGATDQRNRRQTKIIAFVDGTHVQVEFQFSFTETITAALIDASYPMQTWFIARAHTIEGGYAFQGDYYRQPIEKGVGAGLMRNGDAAQRMSAG